MSQNSETYDVCVVGSGAAGGVVAMQLAEKGASVVVLEAGKWVDPAKDFYSHTMPYELPKNGRGWDPRKHLTVDRTKEPFTKAGEYQRFDHFLTKAVGGKSLLWAGLSWRNSPFDFATWPVSYDQLAPYYDRMERLMGVTGNYDHHPNVPDGIFQKPLPWLCAAHQIKKGCDKLDPKKFRMITARKAILTERHESKRPVCHYCGHCMRGCDVDAKYTSANTAMPRALKTGKCKLLLYANAAEVVISKDGKSVTGVRYFDARTRKSYEVKAKKIVLACGPIESARLLLMSKSVHFPNGLANSSGLVGKNLITHTSSSVQGYLKQLNNAPLYNDDGTESGHAYIASFYWEKPHPNFPKGYHIIVDSGSRVSSSNPSFGQKVEGFGADFKRRVRERAPSLISMYSQNGMIPSPERYVELDPTVKDIYGLSVPKVHFSLTTEDRAIFNDAIEKISEIIEASGGVITGTNPLPGIDNVHWVGTCKMGNDAKTSVLTPFLQSHDVKNLFVADGSGFIDYSEKNPTLTVMAWLPVVLISFTKNSDEPEEYEMSMKKFLIVLACVALAAVVVAAAQKKTSVSPDEPIIAAYKKTYPASVSDAVELVTGKNGTMWHDMKLVTGTPIVGRAVTSLVKPTTPDKATPALSTKHSAEMIDSAKPGEVGIIVMEGSLEIAAMGNLMATAAKVRGMAGMVLDGAIRDIWDVRRMGLTIYARSSSPRTAIGHYATVARNVEVQCAGITVRPGDIIVADEDGVVVVPQERAEEVLKKAQEIDDRERGMFPFIRQFKSLQKAVEKFNRI